MPTAVRTRGTTIARAHFRTDIQGLRAVAVLLVLVYHAGFAVPGGFVGVDVFFVISGFLITNHLLAEISATGRLDFARFYARRARRILPASFLVLILTVIVAHFLLPPALVAGMVRDAIATALYFPNILFAIDGTNYLAETAPSLFQHYWSLGVEEQFYLLWPLALVALWLLTRRSKKVLVGCVSVLVVASLVLGVILTYQSQPWAFFSLPSRAWELGTGALVAIVGPRLLARLGGMPAAILGWIGLAAIVGSGFILNSTTAFPGFAAILPVAGAGLAVLCGEQAGRQGPGVLLSTRPMQFLGTISYSLYLVHWPLLILPTQLGGQSVTLPWFVTGFLAVLAVVLAWAMYRWVENPFRQSKALTKRRPRVTLFAAASVSLFAVVLALGVGAAARNAPSSSDQKAQDPTSLIANPTFTDFVPTNMVPSIAAASTDIPLIYGDGCHYDVSKTTVQNCVYGDSQSTTTVALFGDSHAAQWFPALLELAQQHSFRLEVYTKSSCPSFTVEILENGVPYSACDQWRAAVIDHLKVEQPDVIVLSNLGDYPDQGPGGIATELWTSGLTTTVRTLPPSSHILVISDTPAFTGTPALCLSVHLNDADACSRPRADALDENRAAAEKAASESAGATVLDVNDFLCTQQQCGVIIGSTLVYRDSHHLTATFAKELAPEVWTGLGPLLPQ
ncbi:peptidoglycan/LPS O-acetylase OafA/YrhL [Cryobacterium mesophilum]|uniref:Acyltransferase n=1 Tax=Terrimesophilobacter mesophilus TaxID=433647 RepID=A0A4R8VCA7_9MICO|nr:acyltransferase family protein [Terrimesophilobacter mesophilus]MBB5632656.1 peptidoglycan/LPS O-acetylase OafA/YrhL [Terrimesophilobacter mesophilus]TFB79467.1 acyltransferase [Terrimesophilobacter mesophilus]